MCAGHVYSDPVPRLRLETRPLVADRPRWLTAGLLRLGLLCLFIVLCDMLSPRFSRDGAGLAVALGALVVIGGAAAFAHAARSVARSESERRLHLPASQRLADAVLRVVRATGLPLLGFAFFLTWTFVYIGLWWYRPGGAFTGLDPRPRFADFFYYSVSTGLVSPPGDIIAHSRGVRSATLIEMLTGLALVGTYLSSFADFRPGKADGGGG